MFHLCKFIVPVLRAGKPAFCDRDLDKPPPSLKRNFPTTHKCLLKQSLAFLAIDCFEHLLEDLKISGVRTGKRTVQNGRKEIIVEKTALTR